MKYQISNFDTLKNIFDDDDGYIYKLDLYCPHYLDPHESPQLYVIQNIHSYSLPMLYYALVNHISKTFSCICKIFKDIYL